MNNSGVNALSTVSSMSPAIPPPPGRNLSGNSLHRPQSSSSNASSFMNKSTPSYTPTQNLNLGSSGSILQPSSSSVLKPALPPPPSNKPNYNISMTPSSPTPPPMSSFPLRSTSTMTAPVMGTLPPPTMSTMMPLSGNVMAASLAPQPLWGAMQPLKPTQPKKAGKDDWGDFDPLA